MERAEEIEDVVVWAKKLSGWGERLGDEKLLLLLGDSGGVGGRVSRKGEPWKGRSRFEEVRLRKDVGRSDTQGQADGPSGCTDIGRAGDTDMSDGIGQSGEVG